MNQRKYPTASFLLCPAFTGNPSVQAAATGQTLWHTLDASYCPLNAGWMIYAINFSKPQFNCLATSSGTIGRIRAAH